MRSEEPVAPIATVPIPSDPSFPAMKILAWTLPGAALWSIPIGLAVLRYSSTGLTFATLPPLLRHIALVLIILLIPISAICSLWAMELCSKTKSHAGLSVLLMLFNTVTAVLSCIGTFFGFLALVSRMF